MNSIFTLFKRNIKLYFRDKAAVFFSLLSSVIVIALYLLFIANLYINGMTTAGIPLSGDRINFMIYNLVFVSVIVLNSISVPLCAFTLMTKDFETKKTDKFLLAPVKPMHILVAYILSAAAASLIINLATWVIGTVIVTAATGETLAVSTFFIGIAITLLIVACSCMMMALVATIIRSTAALNVVGGVAGTFFGFICGMYMPYSSMGNGIKVVGSVFPFTHLTIWFKRVILDDAFASFRLAPEFTADIYDESFSAVNVGFLGLDIPLWAMIIVAVVISFACLALASFLLRKRITKK
jgi:multidrug/hemolysin transport system permease protein